MNSRTYRLARSTCRFAVIASLLASTVSAIAFSAQSTEPEFPSKPIKLVVYMKPGGLIDNTARKFVAVAAKYKDAIFVVENKHGAGGIVAMEEVQRQKSDGYTLLACTKSNISKVVACDDESYLADFHWLAFLMSDPECVITHRESHTATWKQVIADAKNRPGKQIWLGPENGGLDHVTALKIWETAGMTATWVPCSSGGEALGKLFGRQGAVYVGNPSEVLGNPKLMVAAVSAPRRLPQFPDAPTFRELGYEGLDDEYMWRGIAVKKATPRPVIEWYDDLFRKVNNDPDWRAMWEKGGIDVRYETDRVFTEIVERDRQDFRRYLAKIGLLRESNDATRWLLSPIVAAIVMAFSILVVWKMRARNVQPAFGDTLILGIVVGIATVCLLQTFAFPSTTSIGPETIPQLYVAAIGIVATIVIVDSRKNRLPLATSIAPSRPNVKVVEFISAIVGYCLATIIFGYLLATAAFLCAVLYRLGVRNRALIACVTFGWIGASYVVFVRALYVPLPIGTLWESFQ